jgi:predicted HicB family RNase H-like nuclease
VVVTEARESLNLRVPPEVKRQVEAYAKQLGISVNAAASILLVEGFRAEQKRTR